MAEAEKKNSKTGFYLFMALLIVCVAAYAGLPFFLKAAGQKAPEPAMQQAAPVP
jgi:hypothetical protein